MWIRHSWRTHLKSSTDEREVVALVTRYLAEWRRAEIRALPPGAWPALIATPRAVIEHSVELARLHAAHDANAATGLAQLHELLLFFTHAAVTITRLRAARAEAAQEAQ